MIIRDNRYHLQSTLHTTFTTYIGLYIIYIIYILINFLHDAETPKYTLIPERNLLVIDICFQIIML